MPNFDFLVQPSLPRPDVTVEDAARIAGDRFGLHGAIVELGSQQDRNFRIDTGTERFVLKLANPVFSADELHAQNAALVALAGSGVRIPEVIPALDGSDLVAVELRGQTLHTRVLRYLEGEPLTGVADPTSEQLRTLGSLAGRVAAGLAGLEHPGLDRTTQWDAQVAGEVVDLLLDHVESPAKRRAVRAATEDALARLAPLRPALRRQAVHGDVTDDNIVLGTAADPAPGVIDFGDVATGWLVGELAATVASALHHVPSSPLAVLDTIAAFAEESPLDDADLAALWPLVVLRGAVLVVSGEQQVALDGDNDYADENRAHEWLAFDLARRLDADELETLIRWRLSGASAIAAAADETADAPDARPTGRLVALDSAPANVADLSVTSHALDEGIWLHEGVERRILTGIATTSGHALTRFGEHRMTRAAIDRSAPSATLALAVTLEAPGGTEVLAPFSGTLRRAGFSWVLRGEHTDLWLDGLDDVDDAVGSALDGVAVAAGDRLGTATTLTVQLSRLRGHRPPAFVTPAAPSPLWRAISPDPSALFGIDLAAPDVDPEAALARRDGSFAHVQEHYFEHPPLIERGWRHHLLDTRGQSYIDMVNNVTAVGHGHPRLVNAVRDQWALLNTNSRFHYEELARFTERLAAVAPDGLDTVFLVNSGSEAVDLALRLAQTHTGERTILAVTEAYHGWTVGADAVSSSIGDNPRALETRPDWVELVASPHAFRGRHRGADSAPAYLADLDADLAELDAAGIRPAGFIAEPVFGNAGGVMLPDGYLRGVYERIRARGGVCIADEVQVGYGRLGRYFWGSEQQGVVPDIITVAKAMGNGHPLGAVITTRAIADSFAAEGSFFSSAGGSPVSARVGLTVLDIMRDERLPENATEVGDHLTSRLRELGERHPIVGAVHGLGLYLGVELIRDHDTLEPATAEAALICDRMLAEGCVVQPTGDHKNVLKIKPPLCLTVESADRFADALDLVLATL
ncbi:aminotransferase [Leifsonia sp. NPDC058248]|uniref:aminotransferase n=1 Tax=Leifsonia sp. NPDC058248 TaxID=3346402 RepID=UPI0036DDFD06